MRQGRRVGELAHWAIAVPGQLGRYDSVLRCEQGRSGHADRDQRGSAHCKAEGRIHRLLHAVEAPGERLHHVSAQRDPADLGRQVGTTRRGTAWKTSSTDSRVCWTQLEKSLCAPVSDVTSALSNASCLSFVRELARSSAAELVGIARSHGSGSVCHPTLNMWLRWPCRRSAFFDRLMSKAF